VRPPEPPLDALPPDAAATVEDVRASRRWTWVALAWAIAASVVAVIALIQNSNDKNNDTTTTTGTSSQDVAAQIAKVQKDTNDRLDAMSRRLNDTASSADLQKLDQKVSQLSNDVSTMKSDVSSTKSDVSNQGNSIKQLQSDVKDLQRRVSKLESQQKSSSNGTTTTP
jgi:chromosome segregation ATPase